MNDVLVQLFLLFAKFGLLSFGGGTAVLAEMQREAIGRGWMTHAQFLEAYAIGQMTPGPGTLFVVPIGYMAAGFPGAVAASLGFFLPTAAIALAVIAVWGRVRQSRWPAAVRDALVPVGIGLSWASFYAMARGGLTDGVSLGVAVGSAALVWRRTFPTPIVLFIGAAVGMLTLGR